MLRSEQPIHGTSLRGRTIVLRRPERGLPRGFCEEPSVLESRSALVPLDGNVPSGRVARHPNRGERRDHTGGGASPEPWWWGPSGLRRRSRTRLLVSRKRSPGWRHRGGRDDVCVARGTGRRMTTARALRCPSTDGRPGRGERAGSNLQSTCSDGGRFEIGVRRRKPRARPTGGNTGRAAHDAREAFEPSRTAVSAV